MKGPKIYARLVGRSCLCVLCVILAGGLWPFHVPKNNVSWLAGQNGVHFGRHGTLASSRAFAHGDGNGDASGSLEIWLEPDLIGSEETILSFDGSQHPGDPFSLQQNRDGLEIRRHNIDRAGNARTALCEIRGVFRTNKSIFVTITLADHQTSVYLDGIPTKTCPIAGTSNNNLSGRLAVANSATVSSSWQGSILGLAMYQRQLSEAEVARHYEMWTKSEKPTLSESEAPIALYLFNERAGAIIHNRSDTANDLLILPHYFVLHPAFLSPCWSEYRPRRSYWANVGINIAGFVPLGFCFAAYFYSVRELSRPAVVVVLLGFCVSFIIEVLQALLPTRSSGTTDLITNTLGTAIGLMLYNRSFTQNLWCVLRRCAVGYRQQDHESQAKAQIPAYIPDQPEHSKEAIVAQQCSLQ